MKLHIMLTALLIGAICYQLVSWSSAEEPGGGSVQDPAEVVDELLSLPRDFAPEPYNIPSDAVPLLKLLNENPAAYAPALASHLLVPSGKPLSEKELSDSRVCAGLLASGGTKQAHDALEKYGLDLFRVMSDASQEEAVRNQTQGMFYGMLDLLGKMRDPSLAENVVSVFAGAPVQDRWKIYQYLSMTARGDAKVLASLKQLYEDEKSPLHGDEMLGRLINTVSATDAFSWLPMTFLSKNAQESKQGYITFSAQYRAAVNTLIAIISNEGLRETNPEGVRAAILALGRLRVEEAIPAITRLLDWKPRKDVNDPVNALIAIGKPSANAMLELLASNPPADISNAIAVLRGVEGDDVALFRLTKAMDTEKDETRKKNLTAAIDFLTKMIKEEQNSGQPGGSPPAEGGATPPASGADEPAAAPEEASRKTIFEKYLANGDRITMTVEEQNVKPEEREKRGDIVRTYSLYLTQNGKEDSVSMNWHKIVSVTLNQGESTWNSKVSMYDAIIVGSKYYIFYTYYSDICIDTIEQQDGAFKVTGMTRLRNQASGEKVTNGYLAVLGNRAHALIEYLIGTQELWRLDEDKPTRLWRLDYEELRRQKGQGATPPAKGDTNPPASGGETQP